MEGKIERDQVLTFVLTFVGTLYQLLFGFGFVFVFVVEVEVPAEIVVEEDEEDEGAALLLLFPLLELDKVEPV